MKKTFLGIAFSALAVMFAPQAQGAISFALTVDACGGGCGTAPFGNVVLSLLDPNTIDVKVTLEPGVGFVSTGAGNALQFRIVGDPVTITISPSTPGFAATTDVKDNGPLSGFNYAVECTTACGSGGSSTSPGPLEFTVFRATGFGLAGTELQSFLENNTSNHYFFSADIQGTTTKTGNVFAVGPAVIVTPEPFTMSLVGAGLLMIGLRKVKNRRAA